MLGGQFLRQPTEPLTGLSDRHIGHLGDVQLVDLDRQRFWLQALTLTSLTGAGRLEAPQFLTHPGRIDALEGFRRLIAADTIIEAHGHGFLAGTKQDDIAEFLRQILPRRGQAEFVMSRQTIQSLHVILRR